MTNQIPSPAVSDARHIRVQIGVELMAFANHINDIALRIVGGIVAGVEPSTTKFRFTNDPVTTELVNAMFCASPTYCALLPTIQSALVSSFITTDVSKHHDATSTFDMLELPVATNVFTGVNNNPYADVEIRRVDFYAAVYSLAHILLPTPRFDTVAGLNKLSRPAEDNYGVMLHSSWEDIDLETNEMLHAANHIICAWLTLQQQYGLNIGAVEVGIECNAIAWTTVRTNTLTDSDSIPEVNVFLTVPHNVSYSAKYDMLVESDDTTAGPTRLLKGAYDISTNGMVWWFEDAKS